MSVSTLVKKVQFDTLDEAINVMQRIAGAFAPHEQKNPDMSVKIDAGQLFDASGPTLTEVAAQNTAVITKPTTNPRIDRIVVDNSTGVVSVITGAEAATPIPPAITSGKLPIAQVYLTTTTTQITNEDITDERVIGSSKAASGTVTSVGSGTGLTGGPITTSGTLNVDVGTIANKIVQLDASAKLPAVDGSLLTNLPSGSSTTEIVTSSYDLSTTGDLSFTGAGFTPSAALIFLGSNISSVQFSIGVIDPSGEMIGASWRAGFVANSWLVNSTDCGRMYTSASEFAQIIFKSFDSDGITITRSKTGSPTGVRDIRIWLFK